MSKMRIRDVNTNRIHDALPHLVFMGSTCPAYKKGWVRVQKIKWVQVCMTRVPYPPLTTTTTMIITTMYI